MITRRAMACIAALAAALSVGALGYAVLWAFDLGELVRPAAQPPREAKQEINQETKQRPTPRRRAVVIVVPRVAGEDVREVAAPTPHAMPFGKTLPVAPMRAADEPSGLIAVAPPPTPPTPGEDAPAIAASARVSSAAAAVDRTTSDDTPARSDLMPQQEATIPPIETPPDPEPTGTVQRAPLILHVPAPQVPEPQVPEPEER